MFFGNLMGCFFSLYSNSSIKPNFQSSLWICHHPSENVKIGMKPRSISKGDLYHRFLFAPCPLKREEYRDSYSSDEDFESAGTNCLEDEEDEGGDEDEEEA